MPIPNSSAKESIEESIQPSKRQTFCPQKYSLLLVDDDETQLMYFKSFLIRKGFQVHATSLPREALAIVRQVHIDAIISDFRMPGANGLELIDHLRKTIPHAKQIPIILLTANISTIESMALDTGADLYCEKRDAEKQLVHQIRSLLE